MNPVLSIADLSVSRRNKSVLQGIDLDIEAGEFVGLIGPNGAGKSTLVKSVLGLLPFDGTISLSGINTSTMTRAERARKISYLAQEREINWPLKVRDLVGLGGAELGNVNSAMERLDVLDLQQRKVTELSGGEAARVLVARALAQDTPVLLADEPVAGLDPAHQIRLMQEFARLADQGKTIIACLHELPLASQHCTSLVVLNEGKIIANGPPADVLDDKLLASVYGITATSVESPHGCIRVPTGLSTPQSVSLTRHSQGD